MELGEAIKKLKELSAMLKAKTISDREKAHFEPELHRIIENLEVPELIGEFKNEYLS
tara:strand:- start:1104 stop:1274 length:171 start_codon:yes stop_codon:yes gene_type:complete